MLAEIDTGGPRVLHCDYRADCPIPIELVSTESSLNRDNRVVRTPIVRRLPRSDEKGTATLDDGFVVESRGWFGFFPRRVESASRFIGVRRADETLEEASLQTIRCVDSDYHRNASCPTRPESRLRDTDDRSTLDGATITTGTRTDDRSLEQETSRRLGSSGIPSRIRKNEHEENERDDNRDRRGSWCSKRCVLSTRARNWPRFRVADHVRIGRAARFSSQSSDPSTRYEELVSRSTVASSLADETWKEVDATNSRSRCESRVAKVVPSIDLRRRTDFPRSRERDGTLTSGDRRTRKKKKKKRREYAYANGRRSTYIQLALLLFLVAFGQCGLHKPSVFNHSAKTSTTGLSVLAIGTVISAVSAAPVDLMGDAGVRAERSANLSHITGASRKIQMYIKNRHLQILPDGTVNGSNDDTSDYTIFQRMSVSRGQLRIQGVATCLYLCMDSCGLLYGSREYTDDCVFNETLEQHNYNTYSSAKWSTAKKTLYLGLNRRGQPRRVQAKGHNLGRLSAYARVLTQVAPLDRVEALQRRLLGAKHNVRHRHNSHRGDLLQQSLCPTLPAQEKDGRDKFRCRKRKKRKKRKRKCRSGEKPGPQCQTTEDGNGGPVVPVGNEGPGTNGTSPESKRSCEGAASEEACRREALSVPSKKRKLRVEEEAAGGDGTSAAGRRNVTASSSNGKSKAPASNAKKVNAAGSMSQSKKPNLTDGKKRRKKEPSARRNPAAVPLPRKRFTPGRVDNTSAVPTATSVPTSGTSSSSWWYPGASTVPSGRGGSPRRRTKPSSSPKSVPLGSNAGPRRVGKSFGRNRTRTIGRVAGAHETTTTAVVLDRTSVQSVTVKVPETVSERSYQDSSTLSVELPKIEEEGLSSTLSESLSVDEDSSSTFSIEHAITTIDPTFAASTEAGAATATTLRLVEEENRSVENVDDTDDSEMFDTPDTTLSTTPGIPIERLAM